MPRIPASARLDGRNRQRQSGDRPRGWLLSRQVGRRTFLATSGLAAGSIAALLAACGGSSNNGTARPTSTSGVTSAGAGTAIAATPAPQTLLPAATAAPISSAAAAAIKRGGTMTVPQTTSITEVLNPHTAQNNAAYFYQSIGNQALRPSLDATMLVPELVESWEIPDPGTQITLHVRQGVKWQNKPPTNGRVVSAEDIAYNLQDIAGQLHSDQIAKYQRASTMPNLDSVTTSDAQTVIVKLTAPHSGFLFGMADWRNSMVPKDFGTADNWDAAGLVGSGPFMVDSFQNDVQAVLKANPAYWETGKPYVNQLTWRFLPDSASAIAAFSRGETDWQLGGSKTDNDALKKVTPNAQEVQWRFGVVYFSRFNTHNKPLDDPRVRRALSLALNRKDMGDGFYGPGAYDLSGPISVGFPEAITSDEIAKLPGYNAQAQDASITEAKSLMTAAGFPTGKFHLTILPFSAGIYTSNAVRSLDAWKNVWPDLDGQIAQTPDTATIVRRQAAGDYDVLSSGANPFPHVSLEVAAHVGTGGSRNYDKFSDPMVDDFVSKIAAELDFQKRKTLVQSLEQYLLQIVPLAPSQSAHQFTYFQARVQGATNFGGILGGGTFDVPWAARNMWLKS